MDLFAYDNRMEGRKEGRIEGRLEGRKEVRKEVALEMMKYNCPIDLISKITKLSEDEIKQIAERAAVTE